MATEKIPKQIEAMTDEQLDELLGFDAIDKDLPIAEKLELLNEQITSIEGEPKGGDEDDKDELQGGMIDIATSFNGMPKKSGGDTYILFKKALENKKKQREALIEEMTSDPLIASPVEETKDPAKPEEDPAEKERNEKIKALGERISSLEAWMMDNEPLYNRAKERLAEMEKKEKEKESAEREEKIKARMEALEFEEISENEASFSVEKYNNEVKRLAIESFGDTLPKNVSLENTDFAVEEDGGQWKYTFEFVKTEGTTKTPLPVEITLIKNGDKLEIEPVTLPPELESIRDWFTADTFSTDDELEMAKKATGKFASHDISELKRIWIEEGKVHVLFEEKNEKEESGKGEELTDPEETKEELPGRHLSEEARREILMSISYIKNYYRDDATSDEILENLKARKDRDVIVKDAYEEAVKKFDGVTHVSEKFATPETTTTDETKELRPAIHLTYNDFKEELDRYYARGYQPNDLTIAGKVPAEYNPFKLFEKNSGLAENDKVRYFWKGKEHAGVVKYDAKRGELNILPAGETKFLEISAILSQEDGEGYIERDADEEKEIIT